MRLLFGYFLSIKLVRQLGRKPAGPFSVAHGLSLRKLRHQRQNQRRGYKELCNSAGDSRPGRPVHPRVASSASSDLLNSPKQKGGRGLGHWREASEAERLSQRDVDAGPESGVVSVFPARPQRHRPALVGSPWPGLEQAFDFFPLLAGGLAG